MAELLAGDRRVATITHRLAVAGAAICPIRAPLTGIVLHDRSQYAPELRDAAGFVGGSGSSVSLLAVASGSPAADAGLQAGDLLVAIAGAPLSSDRRGDRPSYTGVSEAVARLERAAATGGFDVSAQRGSQEFTATISPVSGCASRVQLVPSPVVEARSDGTVVSLTSALLQFLRSDDEVALTIAHEMAHNVLGHRALLASLGVRRGLFGSFGTKAAKVLETETAADRFSYYLMARAGFDPGIAADFWKRLYDGPAGGFKDPKTHPDARARMDRAAAIAAEIESKRSAGAPLTP